MGPCDLDIHRSGTCATHVGTILGAAARSTEGIRKPFKALFSHCDDVSLFGAFGPCKKGWADVSRTFDWVAGRYRDGTVRSEYEVIHEGADLAYTVSYERGALILDGETHTHTLRVTQVYRREDGDWRLVHRHGDFAPADQSPPA